VNFSCDIEYWSIYIAGEVFIQSPSSEFIVQSGMICLPITNVINLLCLLSLVSGFTGLMVLKRGKSTSVVFVGDNVLDEILVTCFNGHVVAYSGRNQDS
jgi:hypothetical protein